MTASADARAWRSIALKCCLVLIAYLLAAEVGNHSSVMHVFSTFWPPAGLMVAALLLTETRHWPAILAAGVMGNLISDAIHDRALVVSAGYSMVNAIEPLVGATLTRRLVARRPGLETVAQVTGFIAAAGLAAPMVGATLGSSFLWLVTIARPSFDVWMLWFVSDALGVIVFAPPILTGVAWFRRWRSADTATIVARMPTVAAAAVSCAVGPIMASLVFSAPAGMTGFKFLLFPGFLAAGAFGGPFAAAVAILLVAVTSVATMASDHAATATASAAAVSAVFQAQGFLGVTGATSLTMSALVRERWGLMKRLQSHASQLQAVIDNAPFGAHQYALDDDDRLILRGYNRRAEQMLGIDHAALVGKTLEEAFPGNAGTETPERYRAAALHGTLWNNEDYSYDASGVAGAFQVFAFPIEPRQMAVFFRDVTDLRKAERALATSQAHLDAMFRQAAVGIGQVDLDRVWIDVNEHLADMLGYDNEELKGTSLDLCVHPEERDEFTSAIDSLSSGESSTLGRLVRFLTKSEGVVWALVSASAVRVGSSEPRFMVISAVDETGRIEAESREAREHETLVAAEHIAHLGSWHLDIRTGHLRWSDEMYEIFGVDKTAHLDLREVTASRVHPDDLPVLARINEQVMKDGRPRPAEYRLQLPDGSVRWVDARGTTEFDSDGNAVGLTGFVQDITPRRLAEEQLRASRERLESLLRAIIETVGRLVEVRDPYTAGHQVRVARLAVQLAEQMGLSEEERLGIEYSALLHDIGKLSVPTEILAKPGRLTDFELELVMNHSRQGFESLQSLDFDFPVAEVVRQHHERMDGSGYPDGLSGDDILTAARVIAVADVVEAISSHRPYRPALGLDTAIQELQDNPEKFDPDVLAACFELYERRELVLD